VEFVCQNPFAVVPRKTTATLIELVNGSAFQVHTFMYARILSKQHLNTEISPNRNHYLDKSVNSFFENNRFIFQAFAKDIKTICGQTSDFKR
jgi:hypothetical protein